MASTTSHNTPLASSRTAGLGAWSLYFIVKLLMFWQGLLGFHPLPNLALALLLLVPVEGRLKVGLRNALATVAAVALLYNDSFLPSFAQTLSQLKVIQGFSLTYLLELAGRVAKPDDVLLLVVLAVGYALLSRYLRIGTLVMMVLLGVCGSQLWASYRPAPAVAVAVSATGSTGSTAAGGTQSLDDKLTTFYKNEQQRVVAFNPPLADPGFDILLVHICSLAWDDLRDVKLDNHPLLSRFDFLFTHFNSAAAYSGPAAIRVLRATCGQTNHTALYDSASSQCYLFDNLAKLGFKNELMMNHDGHFDDFLKLVQNEGHLNQPLMSQKGLKVDQHAFDDSPLYDDYEVLNRWLELRKNDPAQHVAAYYNTISLHDGNRVVGAGNLNTQDSYHLRANNLFNGLNRFIDSLEQSHRKVILIMVPEHGAALRGDKLQFSGLREIPTPAITTVPAAIKVIGTAAKANPVRIDQPVSYMAVSTILSRMMNKSPFGADYAPQHYLDQLPTTPYVAENAGTVMMQDGARYMMRQQGANWTPYPIAQ
ncbi:cellulose biosynthesis protein BcsG [Crenobacter sp. SG2305]|uniref:cellulose biosynthesis protein BcsG n=1 Tax=Crenobacter oryzisoli TaxID=3056844 RepID=UPI0025AA68FC|nr:cellulose biosynthesis protein BcsG [Crenobacter sp. SG2305]MDN0084372.1 cellulose biosynthesis protein BcsG [Crenobacter sp. SG2305]